MQRRTHADAATRERDARAPAGGTPSSAPRAAPASAVLRRAAPGAPLAPGQVLQLQRTLGNRAVGRLLAPGALQRQAEPRAHEGRCGCPECAGGRVRVGTPAAVQRAMFTPDEWDDYGEESFNPRSQVKLHGRLGGHDRYFVSQTDSYGAYKESTHAEDEYLDWVDVSLQRHESEVAEKGKVYKVPLVIEDLTASPCSSKFGTSNKSQGCAETLVSWKKDGYPGNKNYQFDIKVRADHYYQPKNVDKAKDRSRQAAKWMAEQGIDIQVGE